jgi:Ca2+-transporting ATPase
MVNVATGTGPAAAAPQREVPAAPYALSIADVAAMAGVDLATGLSEAEADRRFATAGPNTLQPIRREPVWRMLLEAAAEPFVLLLAGSGALAVLLGEVRDGLLVLVGLIPIVGADVITEYRGERALEALRAAGAPRARVRRFGRVIEITADRLVPGDIVLLQGGDVVPADLRCSRTDHLLVDRSTLTGESVPELATVEADAIGASVGERHSMLYAGTSVVGGRGEGIAVATGGTTELGRIAGGVSSRERRRSPLQLELDRLVRILLFVAIGLIATTSGLGFLRGNDLGANVLAGISAAIAAIPEEPPVLLAVILGLGAYRLLRRGVLVRRLNAEETLGAVDLILTDKTGTLTQNRLRVASVITPDGRADDDRRTHLLELALRAEEDAWPRDGVTPGSFTRALSIAVEEAGGTAELNAADLVDAVAASDRERYSRSVARRDGGVEELALGAPEAILDMADETDPHGWRQLTAELTEAGERVVALARRSVGGPGQVLALVGFADPPREGLAEAFRVAGEAGIQTVVVTGDHPSTARAIARAAGLSAQRIVTGGELAAWDDDRLAAELPTLHVVARSTPEDKQRLVDAAHRSGRLVAVTGDGVNDAPALHRADVAVAMGSGTAVAREAADLVLGDDAFSTLVFGIGEGRRIVDNVQKGLIFLISTHVGLLGFIFIATVVGISQPLLPIQILWLELFIDLSTSVAFEREPPEPDVMRRPPRRAGQPLLTRDLLGRLSLAGGATAVGALLLFVWHDPLTGAHGSYDEARWLAFTALVVGQAVRAYANRSLHVPIHRLPRNSLLLAAVIAVVAIQVAIPLIPPLADAFRASPLDPLEWALVGLVAIGPAILAEVMRGFGRGWVA